MKKFFFFAAALVASVSMSAQYAHVDYSALSADEARSLSVGTVLAATAGGNVTVAFDDTWKSVNVKTDGYGWFYAGETALNTDTIGAQGQTNGKDADGGNPANTLLPYASGAALAFEATADGYLTVFHKGSSNKQYIVFEEGKAIGYEYAQLVKVADAPEAIAYTIAGEGEYNWVSAKIDFVQTIVPVAANGDSIKSKNGEAAMRFPVYKDTKYLFGATGSKMSFLGAYFGTEAISVAKVGGEDKIELLPAVTVSAVENVATEQKAVKYVKNGQLFIEKNGVIYNVLGTATK
ncbi:MAG: hypothetical protein MJZ89_00445 [Paludibacteraceae bacterium]|nr:hypothetical protein [Paludibacteraceae bacterium]